MKYNYSYSKMECFKQCKLKYKYAYIDKIFVPKDQEALLKGSYIHWLLEKEMRPESIEVSLKYNHNFNDEKLEQYNNIFKNFKNTNRFKALKDLPIVGVELEWALNEKIQPTKFKGKDDVIHGIIDFLAIKGDTAIIIDWKTGKTKDKKYIDEIQNQLALYSIWVLKMFNVNKCVCQFVYVENNETHRYIYDRENIKQVTQSFGELVCKMETEQAFIPKVGPLCPWCEYNNICDTYKSKEKKC